MSRWPSADEPSEEDEELEGEWELDPNDPTHPDYDLSDAHGYSNWEPAPKLLLARRGVIVLISLVIVIALLLAVVPRI